MPKGKISAVSAAGKVSFDLAGNHTAGAAVTTYDVTATLSATSDLDPLVDAINAHAANTGITAVLGSAASEIILTHQTGETIEITNLQVGATTAGKLRTTLVELFSKVSSCKAFENTAKNNLSVLSHVQSQVRTLKSCSRFW